ncbi:MAG TPA: hypothetical protein VKR32_17565 [Puia sp.]|nr:hypothetical protein [Puia sp.]
MKNVLALIIFLLVTFTFIEWNIAKTPTSQVEKVNFGPFKNQVKWGEHLVTVSACLDCHCPKDYSKPGTGLDSVHFLAGYIGSPMPDVNRRDLQDKNLAVTGDQTLWMGPWGVTFSSNLTSDSATGIGAWTEDRFMYAIRNGKYNGRASDRSLLPTMPWQMYRNMTDDELKAIFAYLKTTKPIKNKVPPPMPRL